MIADAPVFLVVLAALAVGAGVRWFSSRPDRKRWLVLVVAATASIVVLRADALLVLVAVAAIAAATVQANRPVTVAATFAAALTAALLAMPWILARRAIFDYEVPSAGDRGECFVQEGRAFDPSASSWDCVSAAVAGVLERARAGGEWNLDHPAFDVAGIRSIAGRPNRDALPDFYLAPRFGIERASLQRDRVAVDHLPPKLERMQAPRSGAASPATMNILDSNGGTVRIRIRSSGWNVLASTTASWTGWRAYWNGERMPPVVVNHAFVGMFIPPGDGIAVFRYRPDGFDDGFRFTSAGLLLLILTLWKPWYETLPAIPFRRPRALRIPRVSFRFVPFVLLGAYIAILAATFATVASGADESGYLNQARLWSNGDPIVPIVLPQQLGLPPELDGVFLPLGFVHGTAPYTMVPSYPPGLPLMIAALQPVAGNAAAACVVVTLSALGVMLMYALGRLLELSRAWSIAGAAILAVFPTYVFGANITMTDTIATTFALATIVCAMRGQQDWRWAALAGAAVGMGVLVRPTQALIFPAVLIAMRLQPRALLALGAGGLPFAIAQGAISQHLYGNPLATGYGGIGYLLSLENFPIRFRHYSYWLAALGTPVLFPGGAAVWFTGLTSRSNRAMLAMWFLPFFLFYCFYAPYETWWYTRFLLPAVPALIAGALLFLHRIRVAGAVLALAMMITGVLYVDTFDLLDPYAGASLYPEAVLGAERFLPENAVLVTMQMSGAVRYYTGRTIVRWDGLDPDRLRVLAQATRSRPWYALVADFEVPPAKHNLPGPWIEVIRFRDVTLYRLPDPADSLHPMLPQSRGEMADPDLDRIIADLRVRRERMEQMIRDTFGLERKEKEAQRDPNDTPPGDNQRA